jgi:hypothetical protein
MTDPLKPSLALLCKLGSIAVHVDETMSSDGHIFDAAALKQLNADPEVQAWIADMTKMALVPTKRKLLVVKKRK